MGRLIDADEYEKRIKPYDTEDIMDKALYNFAHGKLIETPTAEKTGKWINYKDEHRCSCCGETITGDWFYEDDAYSYCPNCGSRMVNDNE